MDKNTLPFCKFYKRPVLIRAGTDVSNLSTDVLTDW